MQSNPLHTAFLLVLLLLGACGPEAQPTSTTGSDNPPTAHGAFPMEITDASGATINLAEPPERILCLSPACVDILFELDILPVAVLNPFMLLAELPQFYGDRAATIASIGMAGSDPNYEEIAQARPDLVIGTPVDEPKRDALRPIAPLFTINDTGTYREQEEQLRTIGQLVNREALADEAVQRFESRLTTYKAQAPRDRSLVIMGVFPYGSVIYTSASPSCHLLNEVARCPWPAPAGASGPSTPVTAELLLDVDPDVIFIQTFKYQRARGNAEDSPFQAPDKRRELEASPFWQELKAVKTGQIFEVEVWPWGGYGTRSLGIVLDEGLPLLYPQVFPRPLP